MKAKFALAFGLMLAVGAVSSTANAQTVLKAADIHPDGYPTVEAVIYMGKLIDERTKGRIKIQEFNNAVLGGEKDTIEQTQFGVIDFNRVSTAQFNNVVPETSGATACPSCSSSVRSYAHTSSMDRSAKKFSKSFEAKGLDCPLPIMTAGARSSIYTKKPIASIADHQGLEAARAAVRHVGCDDRPGHRRTNPTPMAVRRSLLGACRPALSTAPRTTGLLMNPRVISRSRNTTR